MTDHATSGAVTGRAASRGPAVPGTAELRRALREPHLPATARPPRVPGGDVRYLAEETAVGRLLLAARPDGRVIACVFAPDGEREDALLERLAARVSPRVLRGGSALDGARRQLADYLAGRRREFDLALDPVLATPFQWTVLSRLAAGTGYGQTVSYGQLAVAVGHARAARAVGAALGANPLCVLLPCHRVVASSGRLTGYAGGLEAKRMLLDLERRAATGSGDAAS